MNDLGVLQAVRLKGRVTEAELASTLNVEPAEAAASIATLVEARLLTTGPAVRLTPEGRDRLSAMLADERSGLDSGVMMEAYGEFHPLNRDFKSLVTEWQIRQDVPNSQGSKRDDSAVLAQLDGIHSRVLSIISTASAQLPRLAAYGAKLSTSLTKVSAGETIWFTWPLIDSYHTVWFELFEELILAAGLTREDAARADYAY